MITKTNNQSYAFQMAWVHASVGQIVTLVKRGGYWFITATAK